MEACQWPISYLQCGEIDETTGMPPALAGLEEDDRAALEQMAADYLWRWTGRTLGLCPVQLRPCRRDCWQFRATFSGGLPAGFGRPFAPVLISGQWFNIGCGFCGDNCSCTTTTALRIPGPVDSITAVIIDGQPLPLPSFRVDNGHLLVRQDGDDWPTCQNMDAPAGQPDTFVIDYIRGTPVPFGGQIAAGLLAEQFAKAVCGDTSCALPRRVQSISRQGVTVAILDAFEDITKGHTGIWMIDSWVASMTAPARGGTVRSPDLPNPRRRVKTWPNW